MKCPCEECLKYSICKNREIIDCSDLMEYFFNTPVSIVDEMNKRFPNVRDIHYEEYSKVHYMITKERYNKQ
jgi:hypothetical protein